MTFSEVSRSDQVEWHRQHNQHTPRYTQDPFMPDVAVFNKTSYTTGKRKTPLSLVETAIEVVAKNVHLLEIDSLDHIPII